MSSAPASSLSSKALEELVQLVTTGQFDLAEPKLRRHLSRQGADLAAQYLLGLCELGRGRFVEAAYWLEGPAKQPQAQRDALLDYGEALVQLRRYAPAAEVLAAAVDRFPEHRRGHDLLCKALYHAMRYVDVMERCLQAMERFPQDPTFVSLFANAMGALGQAERALAWDQKAADLAPDDAELRRILCMQMCYVDNLPAAQVRASHERFGELCLRETMAVPMVPPAPRSSVVGEGGRRLRVGVLSPDLRDHPVARFLLPVVRRWAACGQVELFAYSCNDLRNGMTRQLREVFHHWRELFGVPAIDAASAIRADGLDVLLDLAGLTSLSRVGLLTLRLAPVQATWLGYPNTTGVPGVDYRIVDALTDPPGAGDAACSEKLLRTPGCFLSFVPEGDTPEVAASPKRWQQPGAPIVFGSFNNPFKMTDTTLALWRRVLEATPGSKLVIKGRGLQDKRSNLAFAKRFADAGIDIARVEALAPTASAREHLACYEHVDIALDTYPYHGTTTTCEALWMGVPVVCLAGPTHASRVGVSLLTHAGLGEWIAQSPAEYARLAAQLAADRAGLAQLRRTLRARVAASALCDADAHARALLALLRQAVLSHERRAA